MQCMQDAEEDRDEYVFDATHINRGLESMSILNTLSHELESKKVSLAKFMAGRGLAIGTPGAIIYDYMVN
jgi:hypothetical protein